MLNAAIVGLGWWGKQLARAVQGRSSLIRFSRGVTLEPELARDFAAENGLAITASYEDVLADPAIDAVCLATPHTRHRAQVEAAAAAGKHVYCEKPFALSKADAQAALAAVRRAGVALGVGQNMRFKAVDQGRCASCADAGTFGTIMLAEGNYSHAVARRPAGRQLARGGGRIARRRHDRHGHPRARLPSATSSVRCGGWRAAAQRAVALPRGDTTAALIEFRDGALGDARHHAEDAVRLAHRDLRQRRLGGEHERDGAHGAARRQGEPVTTELPPTDHIRLNLDSFAAAALGRRHVPYRRRRNPAHRRGAGRGVPLGRRERGMAGRELETST